MTNSVEMDIPGTYILPLNTILHYKHWGFLKEIAIPIVRKDIYKMSSERKESIQYCWIHIKRNQLEYYPLTKRGKMKARIG
jgi:transposase-like protein